MENELKPAKRAIWPIIVALLVVGGALLYGYRGALYGEMNRFKLLPIPERFTELYFQNSALLPKQVVNGQSISFSFTIHNAEGVTTVYPYAVYFETTDGQRATFAGNTITIDDGASKTIVISHTFATSNIKGKVIVSLTQLNQEIDFLLPNNE